VLADLHVHLYGCVRPADVLEYLASCETVDWGWYEEEYEAAYGTVPPARRIVERYRSGDKSAVGAFRDLCVFGDADAGSFARFQAKANLIWAAADHRPGRLEAETLRFASMVRDDYVAQGVAHAEFRVVGYPSVLEAFLAGSGPLTCRAVETLPRGDGAWEVWERVQQAALGPYGEALVAVDWSGVEEGHPPKERAELVGEVRAFNEAYPARALAVLAHVGESFADKSLESAVRWVHEVASSGAHRLGHAVALGVDPASYGSHRRSEIVAERLDQVAYDLRCAGELGSAGVRVDRAALLDEQLRLSTQPQDALVTVDYDEARLADVRRRQDFVMGKVRELGAVVEVCPTSNRRVAGLSEPSSHPIWRFLQAGLPVVIGSDDPGLLGTTLGQELEWVCRHAPQGEELRRLLIETAMRSRAECLSGRAAAS
jgi:hypothetical protein